MVLDKIKKWLFSEEEKVETVKEMPEVPETDSESTGRLCSYCGKEIKEDHPWNRVKGKDFHKVCWKALKKEAMRFTG